MVSMHCSNYYIKSIGLVKYPTPINLSLGFSNAARVITIKRYYGGKSTNPLKTPKNIVPLKEKPINNSVPFFTKRTTEYTKPNTIAFGDKPTVSSNQTTNIGFYKHNAIKPTISPYKVAPKKVVDDVSHVSPLPNPNIQESFFKKFGFKSFRELLFGPSETNFNSMVKSDVPNIPTNSSNKPQLLVVAQGISPSPYCPVGLDQEFYFRAHLVTAFTFNLKCKMPLEINALMATYFRLNSGQNIQVLEAVAKPLGLHKHPMNMLPYFPKDIATVLPNPVITQLQKVIMTNLKFVSETKACIQLNESFAIPFAINQPIYNDDGEVVFLQNNSVIDGALVYNNTGQPNPDFVRTFKKSDGTLLKETYDLKSSILPLKQWDHVRLVSDNLETILLDAHEQVDNFIVLWQKDNPHTDVAIVNNIRRRLTAIKGQYDHTLDVNVFRLEYNAIRNDFADFFINHRIPMNLIVYIRLEDFPIDISDLSFFQQAFSEFYYSPNSPVINILLDYLAENNNSIKDSTRFFKYLAKRLLESEDF